jgi:hypothetical protein
MMSILAANPVSAVTEFNAQLQILELLDNVSITCLLNNTFEKLDPLLMFTYELCSSSELQFAVIHRFIFLLDFFLRTQYHFWMYGDADIHDSISIHAKVNTFEVYFV